MSAPEILVTGATGFVGTHLVTALREGDAAVRVLVRDAARLPDPAGLDVVEGDLGEDDDLRRALDGVRCAYYLVHSMEPGGDEFAERDHRMAERFVAAAGAAGVGRIVYLGGVASSGAGSEHLDSRHDVETVLGSGDPDLVSLRASMIVGAESDSFRTLAQIVERMPVLALPSWRDTRTQPVAIADVVRALEAAATVEPGAYEIAGADTLTIEEMVGVIGELGGHERPSFPIPISSSTLEGAVAAAFTDSSREVLEPLLEGLHDDLLVEHNDLEPVFGVTPTPFRDAARAALRD